MFLYTFSESTFKYSQSYFLIISFAFNMGLLYKWENNLIAILFKSTNRRYGQKFFRLKDVIKENKAHVNHYGLKSKGARRVT